MAIKNIEQPEYIVVDNNIRLKKFDKNCDLDTALLWYQDLEIVFLVDGDKVLYDMELLNKMYEYWSNIGELYFIEIFNGNNYEAIGDVTLCEDDLPIVIGNKNYHKKGVGTKVIETLIKRAKELNLKKLEIEEIYDYNISSIKLFTKLGFKKDKKTKSGYSYKLLL